MRAILWLSLSVAWGCALRTGEAATGKAARSGPESPVPPPLSGGSGCVESRALKEFVLALESQRHRSRAAALAVLGAREELRPGEFSGAAREHPVGETVQLDGKRLAVVAQLASASPPVVSLALQGTRVHPIDERPRAHPVALRVCGVNACPSVRSAALPPVRPVAVELAPGEELGAPLRLRYDFWWAQVSYDQTRTCPASAPSPASERGAPGMQ